MLHQISLKTSCLIAMTIVESFKMGLPYHARCPHALQQPCRLHPSCPSSRSKRQPWRSLTFATASLRPILSRISKALSPPVAPRPALERQRFVQSSTIETLKEPKGIPGSFTVYLQDMESVPTPYLKLCTTLHNEIISSQLLEHPSLQFSTENCGVYKGPTRGQPSQIAMPPPPFQPTSSPPT